MKEKWTLYKDKTISFFKTKTPMQKGMMIGGLALIVILISVISFSSTQTKMVPLYDNLSIQEVGQIKTELDARGITYEIDGAGTTIRVPETTAESLIVDLAAQGIPDSGNIDYSFFAANSSWGMTENEFNVMELDAMQTELATLIAQIDGIQSAEVMINKPEDPIFVSDQVEEASASIVINSQPGYQFEPGQINALYHLVSKSIPNLPTDNIVIMNQFFEYFDQNNSNSFASNDTYSSQQQIKSDIEKDIERRVQRMLGMMIGMDKVAISATADIDFTQEQRVEQLVEPVDEENMEGLPVSIESIRESYTGNPPVDGAVGAEEGEIPNYPAGEEGNTGDYELVKDSVNNEFNRIQRDIVESPYKIRDLGIQVAIDNMRENADGEAELLTQQEQLAVEESVASILDSIVTTSIDKTYGEVAPGENTSIVFQPFNGSNTPEPTTTPVIPIWMYIVGGVLLLAVVLLIWLLRRRKEEEIVEEKVVNEVEQEEFIPPISQTDDSDSAMRRKQLENYAKDKPEEFAKLLRSWITED